MDVLSLHQAGFEEAVATCGTALTDQHMEKLRRLTHQVVALFDSDEAGARAAERSLPLFIQAGLQPWRLDLPGAKDPDELLREEGPDAMQTALDRKVPLLEWWLRRQRERLGGGTSSQVALVEAVLPMLRNLPLAVVAEVAGLLKVNERALLEQLRRQPRPPSAAPAAPPPEGWRPRREMVHVLWLVVHRRDQVGDLLTRIDPSLLGGPEEVRGAVARLVAGEPVAAVMADVRDAGLARTLSAVVARETLYEPEQAALGLCQVLDALARPRRENTLAHLTSEVDRLLRAGKTEEARGAMQARAALHMKIKQLKGSLFNESYDEFVDLLAQILRLGASGGAIIC